MGRIAAFVYGLLAYALFLGVIVYAVGFVGDLFVPRTVDSGPSAPLLEALLIDGGLLLLFAVQHSVMARPGFKRWWTRFVPRPVERSTYVLLASLILALLFWQWRPIGGEVWSVESAAGRGLLWGGFAAGWITVLVSTFLIDHFDLFGLRQVWLHLRGREYTPLEFREPGFYRFVRHPLYVGFFLAFWCIPTMTRGHLLFSVATTAYILVAVRLEERDLVRFLGDRYVEYSRRVRRFVPFPKRGPAESPAKEPPPEVGGDD